MKTMFTSLLSALIFPVIVAGQPTITNNEFYHVGDLFYLVDCDFSGFSAGDTGVGKVWDFTLLSANGEISTLKAEADTAIAFLTSNLLVTLPNGQKLHEQENSTDSYVNGMVDTATHVTTDYANYDLSRRPFTYLTYYTDTYRVTIPSSATVGAGVLNITGDGYGTLKLPTGTYNNVLRITKHQYEVDTFGTPSFVGGFTTTTYQWFDGVHTAPLLEVDSTASSTGGFTQIARYLGSALGVENVSNKQAVFSAYLDNTELLLNGDFIPGTSYDVVLLNLIGNRVFSETFTATGNTQRFLMNGELAAGIYMVWITSKNDESLRTVIKVIKN